jgi:murein L,D-transpeptidase YafK
MVGVSRIRRAGLFTIAGLAILTLAGCNDFVGKIPKHLAPLEKGTKQLVEKKGMEQNAPILIRIFKEESKLEVWKKQKQSGRYALLKDYDICAWSGVLGPKIKEGDRQAPEGFYTIRPAQMNPNSSYHLSFNMGYPNDFDRAHGRTGSELMVHGACSSRGCYSMQDEQIQEIYTLGRLAFEGGQRDFQVQAFPFRMTPENMARHRDNPHMPFWRMLKEGYDHFEAMHQPPKVDVCDKRYVFNAVPAEGGVFKAASACPPLLMPDEIRMSVAEKDAEDDRKMLQLADKLDRKDGTGASSLLAQALAAPTTVALAAPMSVADQPVALDPIAVAADLPVPGSTSGTAALPAGPTPPVAQVAPAAKPPETANAAAAPAIPQSPAGSTQFSVEPALIAPQPTFAGAPTSTAEGGVTQPARIASTANAPAAAPSAELAAPATLSKSLTQPTPASLAQPSQPGDTEAASLEERMQAESTASDPVANP